MFVHTCFIGLSRKSCTYNNTIFIVRNSSIVQTKASRSSLRLHRSNLWGPEIRARSTDPPTVWRRSDQAAKFQRSHAKQGSKLIRVKVPNRRSRPLIKRMICQLRFPPGDRESGRRNRVLQASPTIGRFLSHHTPVNDHAIGVIRLPVSGIRCG